jgi:hypothetical protein
MVGGSSSLTKLKAKAINGPGFGASKPRALISDETMKASN